MPTANKSRNLGHELTPCQLFSNIYSFILSLVLEAAIVKIVKSFPGSERAACCRGRGEVQDACEQTRWNRSHLPSEAYSREEPGREGAAC